jgi:methyl-accepting chemotaxis protein
MKISIKQQIIGGFTSISLVILVISLFSIYGSLQTEKDLEDIRDGVVTHTLNFIELDKNIIQIQQWLTDVSATRGAEGFDDGYKEAENYYKEAQKLLGVLIAAHTEEPEMHTKLETMLEQLKDFYFVGVKMADTYVKEGPAAGNVYMGKFDPYAAALGDNISSIVKEHKEELNSVIAEMVRAEKKVTVFFIVLGGFALLFAALLSVIISRSVLAPLAMFNSKFSQGASGDLTVHVDYDKNNEIGELSGFFNSFLSALRSLIQGLKGTINDISENSVTLSSASEQFSVTFNQQSAEINNIAVSVDSLTESTTDIIRRLEDMTGKVESANGETVEAFNQLEEVIAKTEEISSDTNGLSEVMVSLVDSSGEIENILKVINDIAEQTNLLALNAAIEAARAGDAGRGFAVVADEVRKLAERTQTATGEVEKIVGQLMNDTENAKNSMDVSVSKVDEGLGMIRNLESYYRNVSDSMQMINEEQGVIMASMASSVGSVETVNVSIQGISTSIREATEAVEQIAGAATNLQTNARLLADRSSEFKV